MLSCVFFFFNDSGATGILSRLVLRRVQRCLGASLGGVIKPSLVMWAFRLFFYFEVFATSSNTADLNLLGCKYSSGCVEEESTMIFLLLAIKGVARCVLSCLPTMY